MTPAVHPGDPAAARADRLMAPVILAIALVIGVVFAHGGACAAVELAESATQSVHQVPGGADHDLSCLHRGLPEHHQHGTEQDCSAIGPVVTPSFTALQTPASVPSATGGVQAPARRAPGIRPAAPCRDTLCVMRI